MGYIRTKEYKEKMRNLMKGRVLTPEWKDKISKNRKGKNMGKNNQNWKGGERKSNGYVYALIREHQSTDRDGYVKRSRLVMEQHLKRNLTEDEVVHHINGIKDDDRIENLILFSSESIHQSFHQNILKFLNRKYPEILNEYLEEFNKNWTTT